MLLRPSRAMLEDEPWADCSSADTTALGPRKAVSEESVRTAAGEVLLTHFRAPFGAFPPSGPANHA